MTTRNRTPLILGIVAGVLAVAVVIVLVLALNRNTAAAPEPPASPGGSESAAPTTPVTPSEPAEPTQAAAPSGIELSAGGFTVRDDAGDDLFAYGWADDATAAVTELTDIFGAEPKTRTEKGDGTHYPDYAVYDWGGFALFDMIPVEGGKSRDEYSQPSYLRISQNTVADIDITAELGLKIGMPVAEVAALGPDQEEPRGSGTRYVFESDRSGSSGGVRTYSVFADTDESKVTAILYFYYSDL